jgi:hypothetical protein
MKRRSGPHPRPAPVLNRTQPAKEGVQLLRDDLTAIATAASHIPYGMFYTAKVGNVATDAGAAP